MLVSRQAVWRYQGCHCTLGVMAPSAHTIQPDLASKQEPAMSMLENSPAVWHEMGVPLHPEGSWHPRLMPYSLAALQHADDRGIAAWKQDCASSLHVHSSRDE